jgi:hypothetical protein
MKHSIVARIFISLLGFALILYNIGSPVLGVIGERDTAIITSVRRQGGERNEVLPGRYTYSIGYTFTLPDGRQVDGSATWIGNAIYIKADSTSTIPVRYFKALPIINVPEKDTELSIGQALGVGLGVFLIYAMRQKKQFPEEVEQND